jgi:hypothetical protein
VEEFIDFSKVMVSLSSKCGKIRLDEIYAGDQPIGMEARPFTSVI